MKTIKEITPNEAAIRLRKVRRNYKTLILGELAPGGRCPKREHLIEVAKYYSARTSGRYKAAFEQVASFTRSLDLGPEDRQERLKCTKLIECPICYSKKKLVQTFETSCGHFFCKTCFRRAFPAKLNCPYCNQIITFVEGDRLYPVRTRNGLLEVGRVVITTDEEVPIKKAAREELERLTNSFRRNQCNP